MKESILSKIKDIALKLAESNDTLTSADLANELKGFGIDGDSDGSLRDFGVEYNFCIDNGENCSAIYKLKFNDKTGHMETVTDKFEHYEINFDDVGEMSSVIVGCLPLKRDSV